MSKSDRLDILVNNSGLSWGSSMFDVNEQKGWDKVFAVNVKALFYLTVALLPLLQKNKTDQDPGRVINISSIYSFFPSPYQPTVPNGGGTFS
jgi:NAD(P)-dependent dehydrogenase (short-subunit alcohol dehydrogenase family)